MKKKIAKYLYIVLLIVTSCKINDDKRLETIQTKRDNIIDVSKDIIDIKTSILLGNCFLYIIDNYLVISENSPCGDKGIHIFNKNTFEYITSTGIIGKGPGEVTRQGRIGVDHKNKILWVSDHGKQVMWKFPLDSILNNNMYKPTEKLDLLNNLFIERYDFLNDSIALGKAVHVLSTDSYDMVTAKLNLHTNVTEIFGYEHPNAIGKKSNSFFALSLKDSIYVNCYSNCDLMTICNLNGNLKCNIVGPDGLENKNYKKVYYSGIDIIKTYIIASYIGNATFYYDDFKRLKGNLPSKFLIFDKEGNYKETLETGSKFTYFCIDEDNNRIIVYFDGRENPLAYFNFKIN
ncbi:MAG: hypothetical protein AB7S48_06725 [Bacteroidales bacterium]